MQPQNFSTGSPPQAVQPIIIQTNQQQVYRIYDNLPAKPVRILGGIQIAIGVLCIIFQIIAIFIHAFYREGGHGIWGGIFFIIAGSYGLVAGKHKTLCPIVTCMVMSIMSAVMTIPVLAIAITGLILEVEQYYGYIHYNQYYYGLRGPGDIPAKEAMNGLIIALAALEAIISIITSALCCKGVCCCRTNNQGTLYSGQNVQYITSGQQGGTQPQMIIIQQTGQVQPGIQPTVIYQQELPNTGYPVQENQNQQQQQEPVGPVSPPQYTGPPPDYTHDKTPLAPQ